MPAPHTRDTIVALASAPGPGGRAIVRLSGPSALAAVGTLFRAPDPLDPARHSLVEGEVALPGVGATLASLLPPDQPR